MMQFERRVQNYLLLPQQPRKLTSGDIWRRLTSIDPEFNVTRRTVERDLAYLAGSRFLDVATDDAKPAGWFRDSSMQISPLS